MNPTGNRRVSISCEIYVFAGWFPAGYAKHEAKKRGMCFLNDLLGDFHANVSRVRNSGDGKT
jgi:hypothetical protein